MAIECGTDAMSQLSVLDRFATDAVVVDHAPRLARAAPAVTMLLMVQVASRRQTDLERQRDFLESLAVNVPTLGQHARDGMPICTTIVARSNTPMYSLWRAGERPPSPTVSWEASHAISFVSAPAWPWLPIPDGLVGNLVNPSVSDAGRARPE